MATSAASKSAQISSLVQQLKAGLITKAELFERLQQLQRQGGGGLSAPALAPAPAAVQPPPPPVSAPAFTPAPIATAPAAPAQIPAPASALSAQQQTEAQAAFTAALAQAQAQMLGRGASGATGAQVQQQMQQAILAAAMAIMPGLGMGVAPPQLPLPAFALSSSTAAPPPPPPSDSHFPRRSSTSAASRSRSRSMGGGRGSAVTLVGGSPTSLAGTGFGSKPTARKSIVGKGELDECTFRPRITPLPPSYGSSSQSLQQQHAQLRGRGAEAAPFEERVVAWERVKRDEMVRAAEERAKRELEECTFTPAISAASREVARSRGHGRGEEVHERLFRMAAPAQQAAGVGAASAARGGAGAASYAAGAADASELLSGVLGLGFGSVSAPSSPQRAVAAAQTRGRVPGSRQSLGGAAGVGGLGRPLFTSVETGGSPTPAAQLERSRLAGSGAHNLTREEQEFLAECTFQPRLNPVGDARPVRSRYRDPTPTRMALGTDGDGAAALRRGVHPPPLPSGLEECTFQPQTNAVRAQSMPAAAVYVQAPIFERLAHTQTASQRERERQVQLDEQARAGGEDGAIADAAAAAAASAVAFAVPPQERERRLHEFLARQEAAARKKEEGVEAARLASAPTLQPTLCEKSLRIVQGKGAGPFLDRIVHDAISKEHENLRVQARHSHDPECTFAPAINPSSRAMRPRSVVDMSRGDALKRETAARLLRLKIEQEDLEGITFRPRINERSRAAEGRLRILSDPDSYVARLKMDAARQAESARRSAAQSEASELAECTFTPAVHGAPEYVSRIAQSMALARSVKELGPPARPDWR